MINGTQINGSAINALSGTIYYNTVTANFASQSAAAIHSITVPVTSDLIITSTPVLTGGIRILERLVYSPGVVTSVETSQLVTSSINLLDTLKVLFNGTISESFVITSSTLESIKKLEEVVEVLISNSSISDQVEFLSTISEIYNIVDTLSKFFGETVLESLILTDAALSVFNAYNTLLSNIVFTLTSSDQYVHILSLSSSLNLGDTEESNVSIQELIQEGLVISIPTASGQDTYLAYTFQPELGSVTTYTNYNFDGCYKFNGKYYFYNSTGLYELGGTTDDGDTIRAIIETAAFSFDTSNAKCLPSIYLGATNSDQLIIKVRVDGRGEFHYKTKKYTNNLQTQKIDLGKGLNGRYFQFELITDATEFNMESIEFLPMILGRKL